MQSLASVCPSVCLSVCLSIHPSVRLSVRPSVRPSVCPSICFHSMFWPDWPLNLSSSCLCVGHDHNLPGIKSQGHRPRSKVNVQRVCNTLRGRSDLDPRSRIVSLVQRAVSDLVLTLRAAERARCCDRRTACCSWRQRLAVWSWVAVHWRSTPSGPEHHSQSHTRHVHLVSLDSTQDSSNIGHLANARCGDDEMHQ